MATYIYMAAESGVSFTSSNKNLREACLRLETYITGNRVRGLHFKLYRGQNYIVVCTNPEFDVSKIVTFYSLVIHPSHGL